VLLTSTGLQQICFGNLWPCYLKKKVLLYGTQTSAHLNTVLDYRTVDSFIGNSEKMRRALASRTLPVTQHNKQLGEGHWSKHGEASTVCTTKKQFWHFIAMLYKQNKTRSLMYSNTGSRSQGCESTRCWPKPPYADAAGMSPVESSKVLEDRQQPKPKNMARQVEDSATTTGDLLREFWFDAI